MLSIIFVNYNTSHQIETCLKSIEEFEKNYRDYEYIIIDNHSADIGLKKLNSRFPYLKIICAPKNGGFAYGNNLGIESAKGDILFLLNPDTCIKDNSIEKLLTKITLDNNLSFIGPQLLFPDGTNQSFFEPKSYLTLWRLFCERIFLHRIFKKFRLFNSYFKTYMNYNEPHYVEQLGGAALMFRRDVINKIGRMDETFFMYFEESDWCFRAVNADLKLLYYPEAKIIHEGGLIKEGNWERSSHDYLISFKYYFEKNFGKGHYIVAYCLFLLGTLIRATGLFLFDREKSGYYFYYLKFMLGFK